MIVDPRKVNLAESDIEQYLFENPGAIRFDSMQVHHWVKRQYNVPSGIVDLFGITHNGAYVVAEVKNVEVDAKAVAQVCRYAFDLDEILTRVDDVTGIYYPQPCIKVLVGPSIGNTVLRECEACNVRYIQFEVKFTLEIAARSWADEFKVKRNEAYDQLAEDDELASSHAFYDLRLAEYEARKQASKAAAEAPEDNSESEADNEDDETSGIRNQDIPF